MVSMSQQGFVHLGLDVSRDSISVAVLEPDRDTPVVDKIFADDASVRHLIRRSMSRRGCSHATKPGRPAMSCTGCSPRWGCAAM